MISQVRGRLYFYQDRPHLHIPILLEVPPFYLFKDDFQRLFLFLNLSLEVLFLFSYKIVKRKIVQIPELYFLWIQKYIKTFKNLVVENII